MHGHFSILPPPSRIVPGDLAQIPQMPVRLANLRHHHLQLGLADLLTLKQFQLHKMQRL